MSEKETCVQTTEIKVLDGDDVKACGFKFNPSCHHTKLPDGDIKIGQGEPCPTEPCPTCPVNEGENIPEPCIIEGRLKVEEQGCDWFPMVCIPSIPPAIGCAPIFGGEGGYDGGVAKWTNNCIDGCDLEIKKACNPNFEVYIQGNWEHVLDLATHPEQTTQLMVRHNGNPREINTQEWHALAYKLTRTGIATGALKEFANESNMGIQLVDLGGGTYGLTSTIDGMAVGTPLPLVSITDADGNITGLQFPLPTP